jgi:hypothetical protein
VFSYYLPSGSPESPSEFVACLRGDRQGKRVFILNMFFVSCGRMDPSNMLSIVTPFRGPNDHRVSHSKCQEMFSMFYLATHPTPSKNSRIGKRLNIRLVQNFILAFCRTFQVLSECFGELRVLHQQGRSEAPAKLSLHLPSPSYVIFRPNPNIPLLVLSG